MRFNYDGLPARVIFGAGRRAEAGDERDRLGIKRALVLSTADQSETCATFAAMIGDRLGAIYPGAVTHTPVQVTESAMHQMQQMNCDGILSVGGGSTIGLSFTRRAHAADGMIRVGFVSPKTGPLAAFAESDDYILAGINAAYRDGPTIGGSTQGVEVIVKVSRSNPNRAADVAAELILEDEVNLMVVSSTPETTNPVSDQCEINGVPCISTVAPWQPWFFTRGGQPDTGFEYTYRFFWGLEDVIAVFTEMWGPLDSSKVVGFDHRAI